MSIFSTSHFRIKIEDAPINQKKKKKSEDTQWVSTGLYNIETAGGGAGWDGLEEVAGSPFGGSRVSSVPQRALCPKKCEPQLRPVLFKCNPGTRSHQSSSAVRDLGSTVDPLNGTFLGQEPREAPVTTDTGAPGWGAI